MSSRNGPNAALVETASGPVQYSDEGDGSPLLFIHGSPGGFDQGALMARFLLQRGHRVIALSRPGYLGTPLSDANATPDAQAAVACALMDSLEIDRFALMCWSGGGPSSYRLASSRPDRVSALVAVAAVSKPYTFEDPAQEKLLLGRFGEWLEKELVHHAPHFVVKMLVSQEGDLTKDRAKEIIEKIWEDPTKRQFALDLMGTIVGDRKAGFENDAVQFPKIDLGLPTIQTDTLLVHATADSDVPYDHSENALAQLTYVDIIRIEHGTHVSTWTDPDSEAIQVRIADFLATP
jgi:pimeloyl-ACP methyl ester carboxylesterase